MESYVLMLLVSILPTKIDLANEEPNRSDFPVHPFRIEL